ncbi:TSUP family transporter [Hominifimenecus sp. rT4P-3]|uniref:TSUP family transporter n=1 Tax=Hominifimenecus sp. rT4P-3 TaxID=3242979 RepID=UPI003DA5EA64
MIYLVFFLVSLGASILGSICGIGGGIIIKPTLDSLQVMGVASISFLSGCTVLTMSMVSVYKIMKAGQVKIQMNTGTPLAIGAAVGGVVGSQIFQYIKAHAQDPAAVGHTQSLVMVGMMVVVLFYTIFSAKLISFHVKSKVVCALLGAALGILSSFLGIGGGPLNLAVLSLFFSMDTRHAAANSLYIILFSQSASFLVTLFTGAVPEFLPLALMLMVGGGLIGGNLGSLINKRLQEKQVRVLYLCACVGILILSFHNAGLF